MTDENKSLGHAKIYRSLINSDLWLNEKFTRGQAWVDLIALAKYKEGFFRHRGVRVDYKKGMVTEGILNLAKRWKWSRGKVERFIKELENETQIEQQKTNVITLVSIVNYTKYHKNGHQIEQQTDNKRTTNGQQTGTHKKGKKGKKGKKYIPAFEEFKNHAVSKKPKVDITNLKLKYEAWIENEWRDGNDREILNWKSKLNHTLPHIKESKITRTW